MNYISENSHHIPEGTHNMQITHLEVIEMDSSKAAVVGLATSEFGNGNIHIWLKHPTPGAMEFHRVLLAQFNAALGLTTEDWADYKQIIGSPIKISYRYSEEVGLPTNNAFWKSDQIPSHLIDGQGFGKSWESQINDPMFSETGSSDWPDQNVNQDDYNPNVMPPVGVKKINTDNAAVYGNDGLRSK